ncbi:hypothetical protein MVEN_01483200 [Mycena venus]|uniref:P-loop containing nucleoside triphosphate hydrolase protein n=1 Tax=Mycena venus TaxID=2733690 RepID=A0A8H6XVE4_9AGAR|nr:hypothetical protein MVEN_01483200 [Mycena venus]
MDLENFDDPDGFDETLSAASETAGNHSSFSSARQALDELDLRWFTLATRRARWMDLLGDYAGAELFIISGESLLERVLNNPLLAIGRGNDGSFQLLHAYSILEKTLLEFIIRRANFEIVFWQGTYHSTIHTGDSSFNVASRHLARSLLFEHLLKLDVVVHTFNDLKDPLWLQFESAKKPMFVLANDGGVASDFGRFHNERALLQRVFLFQLIDGGMAIGLLNGAEFRDSKILSFVYHSETHRRDRQWLSKCLFHTADRARFALDAEVAIHIPTQALTRLLSTEVRSTPKLSRMVEFSRTAVQNLRTDFLHELVFLFLLHAAVLPELSLLERAQPSQMLRPDLMHLLSNLFLPDIFFLVSHLPFDIDGRVFLSLISIITTHPSHTLPDIVGPLAYEEVHAVWTHLSLPIPHFSTFRRRYAHAQTNTVAVLPKAARPYQLLPFNHQVFDFNSVVLPDTSVEEEIPISSSHLNFGIPFSDTKHWHNTRSILPSHLGGEDHKVLDARQRRRENRSNQRFMTTLQKSAATLTGALGTSLQQITIVSAKTSKDSQIPKPQERGTQSEKKGKVVLNSTQKLREKIKQEKTASQDDVSYKWWKKELENMSPLTTNQRAERIQSLFRNKRSEEPMIGLEMRLYSLHLTLRQWVENSEADSALVRDRFTVAIMKEVKTICDRKALTTSAADIIKAVLKSLGFAALSPALISGSVNLPDRPLTFPFEQLLKTGSKKPRYKFMSITEHPVEWQLRLFGEFMDRSMDSAPDSRVSFKPDAWQREVLDCIDKKFSVLVIAPTSAGKTFISYYSMEKILRDSDDGILVYIAPTKALVTQIAAEIYARFKKTLTGKSLWAIHTRDYRVNDPLKCQILVTVPEILATLLLSPPLARVWTPRLKSIILDEIHSIGQQEGGSVWEQIILMAPCPIIGLSATVGTPEDFSLWLESVQNAHGFKYRVIQHPHRYSHLRKFYYIIDDNSLPPPFKGLALHRDTQRSRFLHPISLMSFGIRSIPEDLALEAPDTLTLYRALAEHAPSRCEALHPQTFFSSSDGSNLLVQKDVIAYEHALKKELMPLLEGKDEVKTSSNIIRHLQDPKIRSLQDSNTIPSRESYRRNLIFLLSDLHVKGELPAILFSFDRMDCEILAQELLLTLKTAESHWRNEDPKWKEKIRQWEQWTRRAKERERALTKAARRRKDDDAPESLGVQEYSWESSFDPNDPSPQFSFAGMTAYSKSDLAEQIQELRQLAPDWAWDALERGVGVHHAGMNKKYRSLVESLFRQGFIRVMIATGTLALGINAPAKTTVFCGDSPFLTALMYRQCSGRAGRRGFDLLGNVVFYGLPMERVQRLVLSRLPPLGGNFPLTSTLSLRLMNLLSGSNDAEVAVAAVKSILQLPRISFVSNMGREQVLHHMRFSIEYLRRSGLLNRDGKPMDLFSMAAHLYYHEPSNFALVALLKSGVLHEICDQNPIAAKRDYILIMAHLFGRRYISRVWASEENLAAAKKSPSMVVLPELPKAVRDVLEYHDQKILETFTGYAHACTAQLEKDVGQEDMLPLSKASYPCIQRQSEDPSTLRTRLRETAVHVVARSPFVANSGHTDKFSSVEELVHTTRNDLHLNNTFIPSMRHLTSEGGHLLNAYLLDFYIHGQVSTLAKANGIRRGDVWYLLQDFSLSLTTIQNSLKQLLMAVPANAEANDPQLHDPAEMEEEDDSEAGGVTDSEAGGVTDSEADFQRPAGVKDRDWKLYTIANGALRDFDEKFKAMWA